MDFLLQGFNLGQGRLQLGQFFKFLGPGFFRLGPSCLQLLYEGGRLLLRRLGPYLKITQSLPAFKSEAKSSDALAHQSPRQVGGIVGGGMQLPPICPEPVKAFCGALDLLGKSLHQG